MGPWCRGPGGSFLHPVTAGLKQAGVLCTVDVAAASSLDQFCDMVWGIFLDHITTKHGSLFLRGIYKLSNIFLLIFFFQILLDLK